MKVEGAEVVCRCGCSDYGLEMREMDANHLQISAACRACGIPIVLVTGEGNLRDDFNVPNLRLVTGIGKKP